MSPFAMKIWIALMIGLLASASLGQKKSFDQQYKELCEQLKQKKLAEMIAPVKSLLQQAQTPDQKRNASRMLADLCKKAGQHREAADAWVVDFNAEIERNQPKEAIHAASSRIWNLERVTPLPVVDIEKAIREVLAWEDGAHLSLQQKTDFIGRLLKARAHGKQNPEIAVDLEKMVEQSAFGPELKGYLLLATIDAQRNASNSDRAMELCGQLIADQAVSTDDHGYALFKKAELLNDSGRPGKAVEQAEQGLKLYDQAAQTKGRGLGWHQNNLIKWAGALARDNLMAFDKAHTFFDKLIAFNEGDYWKIPALMEKALTYRKQGQYDKAEALYTGIAEESERSRPQIALPIAEMVYYDIKDRDRGLELLKQAFANENVAGYIRYPALFRLVQQFERENQTDAALEWLAAVSDLPNKREEEAARYATQAYYEMARIHQMRNEIEQAKEWYRKAMNMENGHMQYRVRARNALEDIAYFE